MKSPELEYYERIAPKYDELHAQPIQLYHTKVESELIQPYLYEGQKVAVIGCGGGREFEYLLKKQIILVGVDFSRGMLDKAKEKIQKLAKHFSDRKLLSYVSLIQADAANLPFGDSEFDLVFCLASLNYFPNYEKSLLEMNRVVKPGGKVIVTVINRWELSAFVKRIPSVLKIFKGGGGKKTSSVFRKTFTMKEMKELYRKAGLNVCRVEGIRLFLDFIPQAWNTRQEYFSKAQKAIQILSMLDQALLKLRFCKLCARFLMLVGEKPYGC